MYPKLYSKSNQLLAVLDNIIKETATTKRVVNGEFTFSFSAFEKELKSEYFEGDNYIVVSNQAFDIKYVDKNHQDDVKYDIQCEHVNYRMEDGEENLLPSYIHMGTPREILTDILLPTEFHVGVVDFTDVITISVDTEITRKSLIYQLAKALGGEVDYTDNGFGISILRTIGKNNGFEARFGKNLKGITKTIDRRGGLKTYYVVDIIELKKSNAYIEKKLQSLEIIDVGDTIRLKDSVIGLDVENRILSVERNPILEINTKLEIANTIELITDTLQRIETESVKQGKSYNFASISSEYGFRARRSDQLAQATLGGGILSFDVGDGTGQYTPAIYFDVTSGKFKIIGDIEMQGGSINWTSVDSPDYSYDEIIGQKPPIDADNTNSVIGTRLTHIDQYGIYTGLLEAEQVTAGILRGITLDLDTDARIGYNLRMGNTATLANRMIEFYNAGANDSCFIGFSGNSLVMSNSAGDLIAGGNNVVFSAPGVVSIHALSGGTGTFLDGPKVGINPTTLSFFGVSGGGRQFVSELPYGASSDDIINQINAMSYGLAQLGLFNRFEI